MVPRRIFTLLSAVLSFSRSSREYTLGNCEGKVILTPSRRWEEGKKVRYGRRYESKKEDEKVR